MRGLACDLFFCRNQPRMRPSMPSPGGFNDALEVRQPRGKPEPHFAARCIGDEHGRITWPPWRVGNGQPSTSLGGDGIKHLLNRIAAASTKIERPALPASKQALYRSNMRLGKVRDMNVISDGGPVGGRIVGSKYGKVLDIALDRHHRPRNEMGLRMAQFAELAFWIGSTRVEISERYCPNVVGLLIVAKDALDYRLRRAIRIDGILRRVLVNGTFLRFAVDGARAREHDLATPRRYHGAE